MKFDADAVDAVCRISQQRSTRAINHYYRIKEMYHQGNVIRPGIYLNEKCAVQTVPFLRTQTCTRPPQLGDIPKLQTKYTYPIICTPDLYELVENLEKSELLRI